MEFRIGINVGDVIVEGPQLYGDGVNIAARLEALAEGGGICISGTVYDQIENKLALGYESLGEQTVKNIAKPVRVYQVIEPETVAAAQVRSQDTTLWLPLPDKPSIVVLPFVNLSNDPEQEYFSDGLTEDITTDLSKISSLFVISRNSAFTYKGKAAKARDISREMGVRYVLEGSVRKAGERIRISAQLIDATTDHHLWSERYDRPVQDIFALQDEIRQKIVLALKVQIAPEEQAWFQRAPTNNLEAYDFFLRGEESFWRAIYQSATFAPARQMYEKAIELDPQYATAYARLGETYLIDWYLQGTRDQGQSLERAFELAQRAVALDDALSLPHAMLGIISVWKKQHAHALVEAERAITLDPNFAEGYFHLSAVLYFAGLPEAGIRALEQAIRLNPRYPDVYLFNLAAAYRVAGRYEEALDLGKKFQARQPDYRPLPLHLAVCYAELGRLEEARAEGAEILRLNPNFSLEGYKHFWPMKDPAVMERTLAALRKAGLK
jgi:adenylate cyclase